MHLRPQYLQIHPSAFDILHRSDLEGMPFAEDSHIRSHGKVRNHSEPKKVGGSEKRRHVRPFLTAMPTFPVCPNLCHGHICFRLEAVLILYELFLYDGNEGVHLAKAHTHTFQSRSSRRSKFTVFHTCCAALVLSAKKPPVEPSLDS